MLTIETSGTWTEMGEQLGKTFPSELRQCMDRYASWLVDDPDKYRGAIGKIREMLERECPKLVEETEGLARGADLDPEVTLGFRFFNEVRDHMDEGCSVIFLADSDVGPLLARNCDLDPNFDPDIQLCRICRPEEGAATLTTTYLGMASGVGVNDYGFAMGSASSHTRERYGDHGLPGQVLVFLLLDECKNLEEARQLLSKHPFLGKPANVIAGDTSGSSTLFEMAPGRTSIPVDRPHALGWQVCTNFFISGGIPIDPEPEYLQSAYARYGRMVHVLARGQVEHSVDGAKELLTEIAQPGLCDLGRDGKVKTAYSQVIELRSKTMHYTPGHPEETEWESVKL